MGLYINPPDMTKEEFLARHGTRVSESEVREFQYGVRTQLPVCLVHNGAFTAAGIADIPSERAAFLHSDPRPKKWFLVDREVLKPYMHED